MTHTKYHIGTSGFSYPHWRGLFYPDHLPQTQWLEHYAQTFPTLELNNTFHRLPRETTVQNWRDRTPLDFLFAVKASRLITHLHRLHSAYAYFNNDIDGRAVSNARTLSQLLPTQIDEVPDMPGISGEGP